MKRTLLALLAAVFLAPTVFATTATVNYSDLWWNPAESGWGVTVAQEGTTLFLTFYIYSTDSRPTWAVATLYKTGQSSAGQPIFAGALHVTTGPYFGAPFNPGAVTPREAGTAVFAPNDATTATLSYSIDGVPVTKSIRRQTLANENLSGTYVVITNATVTCTGEVPETILMGEMVTITHSGTSFQWREYTPDEPSDYCLAVGTSVQEGQFVRASGTATCTSAAGSGSLAISEVTSTPLGLTGRYAFTVSESGLVCRLAGPFTALRQ